MLHTETTTSIGSVRRRRQELAGETYDERKKEGLLGGDAGFSKVDSARSLTCLAGAPPGACSYLKQQGQSPRAAMRARRSPYDNGG